MSRPPFPKVNDFLQVYLQDVNGGSDRKNFRDTFYSPRSFNLSNNFSMPGSVVQIFGSWIIDAGDLTLSPSFKETRAFALQGKLAMTVTGTSIIVRVQLNPNWGTWQVYIDGVRPSTIAGLTTAKDSILCDANTYVGVTRTQYRDILVADNLTPGSHLIEMYANTASTTAFCVLSGIKTRAYSQIPITFPAYHSLVSTGINSRKITFSNLGTSTVKEIALTVPPQIVTQANTAFGTGTVNIGDLVPGASYDFNYSVDGTLNPDITVFNLQLSGLYLDPAGTVSRGTANDYKSNDAALTYVGAWNADLGGPAGVPRAFSSAAGQTVSFSTSALSIDFVVERDFGWGDADVSIGGTLYGNITSYDAVGGGFAFTQTISGLPAGLKTVTLTSKKPGTAPFVLLEVKFTNNVQFSLVNETIPLSYTFQYVPPYPAAIPAVTNGRVSFGPINTSLIDNSIPRNNIGVTEARVYTRFPTFAVYYASGNTDILNEYDILIIEPTAINRKQVAAWQARGIKVFGYVSFGEEGGEGVDVLDPGNPALKPHTDDGLGVGGYASYYNKGGNFFGEVSECKFDRQRKEGVKACTVLNPHYYVGTGRCGVACTNDSVSGYVQQSVGGACAAGYTILNNYQRDAAKACDTITCPSYSPVNSKCPQYIAAGDTYGQDFAILDVNRPDQNGIFNSTFINPLMPRWKQKLQTFYIPVVLDAGVVHTETKILVAKATVSAGNTLVCQVSAYPIDSDEPLVVTNLAGTFSYVLNVDYTINPTTGVFVLNSTSGGATAPVVVGSQIVITYTKKGLQCDGLFMDTVDTVDVYPSPAYQQAFADLIKSMRAIYPNKYFCSNRGFTILAKTVQACTHVMFETFLSTYNYATKRYEAITDAASVAYNQTVIDQLKDLRLKNNFDVFGLNYADNGPAGDALRAAVADRCFREGYMSWVSVISLQDPLHNNPLTVNPKGVVRSNTWQLLSRQVYSPTPPPIV